MKSIKNLTVNDIFFNYDKFVDNALISSCSLFTIKDGNIIIYVNDPNIKIFINQIKFNILREVSKYTEIKEILILDDKKNIIKERNNKRKRLKEAKSEDIVIEKLPISEDEKKEILENISKVDASDEVINHLKNLAEIYFVLGKEKKEICPVCKKETSSLFKDKCIKCVQKEVEYQKNEAYYTIKENPYVVNNSKIYKEAREKIVEEKVAKIFKYLEEKKEKSDIAVLNNLFMDYAIYFSGSNDSEIQYIAALDLKNRLYNYYKKNNIYISALGENNE
ncbi:hypothetical protein HP397_01580 [Streptobacillus felis]|uniref:Uncharacterized protein n=1 Tax=Streptobacillus felis TaxID=1384509 RepID=A0A7Z0PE00_9FUSO|nr:hypothetical protein [Streptobacillus felis]NYV27519.1 hypothetical protein [Streptobacillus felis]